MGKREGIGAAIGSGLAIGFLHFDLSQPLGVAGAVPYIVLPAIALLVHSKRLVVACGILGLILIAVGFLLSPPGNSAVGLLNRGLTALTIVVVTLIGYVLLRNEEEFKTSLILAANTDVLTGARNRRAIMRDLERRMAEGLRYEQPLSLLLVDIDHFKRANDTSGHVHGDEILRQVSETCLSCVRETDSVGRYGGDEFLVVCPQTGAPNAFRVAERIRTKIAHLTMNGAEREPLGITVSIGIAPLSGDVDTPIELLRRADHALYTAKEAGRNATVVFKESEYRPSVEANNDRPRRKERRLRLVGAE